MVLLRELKPLCCGSLLMAVCLSSFALPAYAVDLPSGTSQVVLQTAYPGETTFTIPAGSSIVFSDTPVVGDNSQNWVFINRGLLSATSVSTASGLMLSSATPGAAMVINYGTLQTAGTVDSNAAGLNLRNGGQIINQPGGVIQGHDGINSSSGFVQLQNYGLINGDVSGIFTNAGLRATNYAGATFTAGVFGTRCFGGSECTLFNYGTLSAGNIAVDFEGSGSYSLLNAPSGIITAGNNAVLFNSSNGQFINQGFLHSTNSASVAVNTKSSGDVYVNTGTITGGANGTGMLVTGSGNTIYNLGTFTGSPTAISLIGDNNQLVLGTHVLLPIRNIDVFGPGSIIDGAIVASGAGNSILLTDNGSEDTPFTGFASLAMAGDNWVLTNSFALNGTGPESLAVRSGRLLLTGNVSTGGGVTVANGGTLLIGGTDNKTATLSATAGATVNAGGVLGGGGLFIGDIVNNGQLTTAAIVSNRTSAFTIQGNVTNGGAIVLAGGAPGNTMTISGNLLSVGGRLVINTVLAGDASATDLLILDGGTTSGTTSVVVQNAGAGSGEQTSAGIRIVQTINGATTAANAFALDPSSSGYRGTTGTLAIGAFDYSLARGGIGGSADDWYLTSIDTPSSGGGRTIRLYRPEVGLYLANQAAARTMFNMTLRDREGYASSGEGYGWNGGAGWARVTGGKLTGQVGRGSLNIRSNGATVQAGIDLWGVDSATYGEFRAGIMGGYGRAETSAKSRLRANYNASGDVSGYSVGFYGTWRQNKQDQTGAYADIWAQYNWFDNELRGGGLPAETYDTRSAVASVEVGYSFELANIYSWRVLFEPQVQAIYADYHADRLIEGSRTTVRFQGGDGLTTRVGGRLSGLFTFDDGRTIRPYLEANWWRVQDMGSLRLNATVVRPDLPNSFAEVKLGAQGEFAKNWSAWGHVAVQVGKDDFRNIGGQVGLKFVW